METRLEERHVADAVELQLVGALGEDPLGDPDPLGGDLDAVAAAMPPAPECPRDREHQQAAEVEPEVLGG